VRFTFKKMFFVGYNSLFIFFTKGESGHVPTLSGGVATRPPDLVKVAEQPPISSTEGDHTNALIYIYIYIHIFFKKIK
jgi:hypothetical protein